MTLNGTQIAPINGLNMSRGIVILIAALSAVLVALLFLPKFKSGDAPPPVVVAENPVNTTEPSPAPAPAPATSPVVRAAPPVTTPPRTATVALATNRSTNGRPIVAEPADDADPFEPMLKPLPVLERDYAATTNRETRLDIIMDVAETANADAVRTLTRLFDVETDPELKVDLLDSLLGIDGFKDEKLIMLTLGMRQGLPNGVRQSAIDGLIDLEDQRAIPLLNGLLNDPDEEIREAAQDALELLQNPEDIPKLR